jgi:Protein kinase domain
MSSLVEVGTEFAGYWVRSVIARGDVSVVYRADNPEFGDVIALKVLAPELCADQAFHARFALESRIAASLRHPNVIPIYDIGRCGDLLYIAMRYVAGVDLRTVLKTHGVISTAQALSLIGQAGRALDAAHRHGLVHRHVKPANILIERGADEDDANHVYLTDFGITTHALTRNGPTATGPHVGANDYIAPEQLDGRTVDGRADVYSLGCVLYESLTGRVPFFKDLQEGVISAHGEGTLTPPTAVRAELPHPIDEVIGRALAKDPEDRYATCRELLAAARTAFDSPAIGHNGTATAKSVSSGPATVLAGIPVPPARPVRGTPAGASAPWLAPPVTGTPDAPGAGAESPPAGRVPGARQRRGRRRLTVVAVAVLGLATAGIIAWLVSRDGGSSPPARTHAAAPAHRDAPLMNAVRVLDNSPETKGMLSPSTCVAHGMAELVCTHPAPAASTVTLRTFPSLEALYAAYVANAKSLAFDHRFRNNFGDCLPRTTNGEVSWNHDFRHPRGYSLADARAGMLNDNQAAGRVYCTFAQSQFHIVWTMDDGRLLATVSGAPHKETWRWWRQVHHAITVPAAGSDGGEGSQMDQMNESGDSHSQ